MSPADEVVLSEADVLISVNDVGPMSAKLVITTDEESFTLTREPRFPRWPPRWQLSVSHCPARQFRRLTALIEHGAAPAVDQPVEVRIFGEMSWHYSGRAWMTSEAHDLREPELCFSLHLRSVGDIARVD